MVTSDDRWTCPECGRTFVLDDDGSAAMGLSALQMSHAHEHDRNQVAQVPSTSHPSKKKASQRGTNEEAP
jgi:transposase-like protein